jgi:hypothetical protein
LIAGMSMPLPYLLGKGSSLLNTNYSQQPVTGVSLVQPIEWAVLAVQVMILLATNLCNATASSIVSTSGYSPGNTTQGIGMAMATVGNQSGCWPIVAYVGNQAGLGPTLTYGITSTGLYGLTTALQPLVSIQASSPQPLPDFEMGINNGSAIFSISSGTITEP